MARDPASTRLDLQLRHRLSHSAEEGKESEQDQSHDDGPFPAEDIAHPSMDDQEGAISHQICRHDPTGRLEFAKLG